MDTNASDSDAESEAFFFDRVLFYPIFCQETRHIPKPAEKDGISCGKTAGYTVFFHTLLSVQQVPHAFQTDQQRGSIVKQRRRGRLNQPAHAQKNQSGIDAHDPSVIRVNPLHQCVA